jgi:hypothetical protein
MPSEKVIGCRRSVGRYGVAQRFKVPDDPGSDLVIDLAGSGEFRLQNSAWPRSQTFNDR